MLWYVGISALSNDVGISKFYFNYASVGDATGIFWTFS